MHSVRRYYCWQWLASHLQPLTKALYWLSYPDSSDKQPDDVALNSWGGGLFFVWKNQPHSTAAAESLLPSTPSCPPHTRIWAQKATKSCRSSQFHGTDTYEVSGSHTGALGRSGVPGSDAVSFGEYETLHGTRDFRIWRRYFCRKVGNRTPPHPRRHSVTRLVSAATPLWEPEISYMSIPTTNYFYMIRFNPLNTELNPICQ